MVTLACNKSCSDYFQHNIILYLWYGGKRTIVLKINSYPYSAAIAKDNIAYTIIFILCRVETKISSVNTERLQRKRGTKIDHVS